MRLGVAPPVWLGGPTHGARGGPMGAAQNENQLELEKRNVLTCLKDQLEIEATGQDRRPN